MRIYIPRLKIGLFGRKLREKLLEKKKKTKILVTIISHNTKLILYGDLLLTAIRRTLDIGIVFILAFCVEYTKNKLS